MVASLDGWCGGWLEGWLVGSMIYSWLNKLIYGFIDWLIFNCWVGWMVVRLLGRRLMVWVVVAWLDYFWMVCYMVGCQIGYIVGWTIQYLIGYFVD